MPKSARSEKLLTPPFRVSFPHLDKPSKMEGSDGPEKYSTQMIFDLEEIKSNEKYKALFKAIIAEEKKLIAEVWGDKPPKNLRKCLRDGAEKEDLTGYGEGTMFGNATSKHAPGCINAKKEHIMPTEIYAGCYARATVNLYTYDVKGNRGITFGLHNIQMLRDGESLAGGVDAQDDIFDAFETKDELTEDIEADLFG